MIYHHHARQGQALSVAHPASRSVTSPPPSVTVMIRPAADETTTRDGRPFAQAGTAYVANGPASYAMRGEELAVAAPAEAFRTRRRDGLTTTAAAVWLLDS